MYFDDILDWFKLYRVPNIIHQKHTNHKFRPVDMLSTIYRYDTISLFSQELSKFCN